MDCVHVDEAHKTEVVRKTETHALAVYTPLAQKERLHAQRADEKDAIERKAGATVFLRQVAVLIPAPLWVPGAPCVGGIRKSTQSQQVNLLVRADVQVP